ncbi:MAG: hypothetical protein IJM14_06425 [Lachnospiraceae bacterium]|nr:hypothetical protein [Lachnospiraceae bacterium]
MEKLKEFSEKLIEKNFRISIIIIVFLLSQLILLSIFLFNAPNKKESNDDVLFAGGMEIFLPISQLSLERDSYSIPIGGMEAFSSHASLIEKLTSLTSVRRKVKEKGVVFCLEDFFMELPDKATILEMYCPDENEYLNTLTLDLSPEMTDQTLRQFVNSKECYITALKLDENVDNKEIARIVKKLGIEKLKIYCCSKEITAFMIKASVYDIVSKYAKLESLVTILFLMGFILYYSKFRNEQKKALLFYQYGYNRKAILSGVCKKYKIIGIILIYGLLCSTIAIGMIDVYGTGEIVGLLGTFITFVSGFVIIIVEYCYKKFIIRRGISWNWR